MTERARRRPWRRRILLALLVSLVLLGAAEGVCRIMFGDEGMPLLSVALRDEGSLRLHDTYGFVLEPGDHDFARINQHSLRGPDFDADKPEGCLRILIVGDSTTFGTNIENDETYPAQLQAALAARHPGTCVEVINAGLESANSAYQLRRTLHQYVKLDVDVAVIALGWSDMGSYVWDREGWSPDDHIINNAFIVEENDTLRFILANSMLARAIVSLSGFRRMAASAEYFRSVKDPAEAVAAPLAAYESHLSDMIVAFQAAGAEVHLLRSPCVFRTGDPRSEVSELREKVGDDPRWMLDFFDRDSALQDVFLPPLQRLSSRHGVNLMDCFEAFEKLPLEQRAAAFVDALHPGPEGCRILATCLLEQLGPATRPQSGEGSR